MNNNRCDRNTRTKYEKWKLWKIPALRQMFVILGLMGQTFCAGAALGTPTVMLPQLQASGEMPVPARLAAWIYAGHGIGSVPVAIVAPFLAQWKGYKTVFAIMCVPMIISFVIQYLATNAIQLLVATLCQGATKGGNISLGIMAITEYAEPRLRGPFLVMKSASYFWGVWMANAIGTFFYWRYTPLVVIWPAIFSFCSCFAWPNGPYWLASKGRTEECREAFAWLRGRGSGRDELESIIKAHSPQQKALDKVKGNAITKLKRAIVLREFYMPLSINFVLCMMYYSTGKTVFTVYALVIIKQITGDESTAYTGMLIIDGVTILGMYVGSYVAMKVKRRVMLLSTTVATIVFLSILSIYLSLAEYGMISLNNIVSLLLLVVYSFAVSWGPMVLCTSFFSELAPMRFKTVIVATSAVAFWSLQVANLRLAPVIFALIGVHGTFGIYAIFTLICWIFLYYYLPETSGKTLQELDLYFVKK